MAAGFPGEMAITLHGTDGQSIRIGTLKLTPDADGYRSEVVLDDSRFEDHFLSMRPFKCVPHAKQMICHLPYPYVNRRHITEHDLTDLEYDLLFLHKRPEEYGIDAWNGFYYELRVSDGGIVGELRETDLNVLAVPPATGERRPIGKADLHPAADAHWPQRITIR